MTAFLLICAAMVAAALFVVVWPLLRQAVPKKDSGGGERDPVSAAILIVVVPALAVGVYFAVSNWQWNRPADPQQAANVEAQKRVADLERHVQGQPEDVAGLVALGRSYVQLRRFDVAVDAYQKAYDLTQGENVEAIIGLGEALTLVDEKNLAGRAGELFEQALRKAPGNPKVLWYSSLAALSTGKLAVARERMQLMLAQNPPPEIRNILERQIEDVSQQLGEAAAGGGQSATTAPIKVSVTLAPALAAKVPADMPLFVLARESSGGGPPLAAVRRSAQQLPLTVELSEKDAMIPGRSIAGKSKLQIVARLSRSGQPVAQSGDFFGEADYDSSAAAGGTIKIEINKTVP